MIIIIPLYILGILRRFGPQHGYKIKKIISQQLSDFTQIKLPAIYYHLEKMEKSGLLSCVCERSDVKPEKTIYSITEKGNSSFIQNLNELIDFDYRPSFDSDSVFFFSDCLDINLLKEKLKTYINNLKYALCEIEKHKDETLTHVPPDTKISAQIIFEHHLCHFTAELKWAEESLKNLN